MNPKERARKLVALATDPGASSEEARTAAMAACRLIARHELLDPSAGHGAARRSSPGRSAQHENGRSRHDGEHQGQGDGAGDGERASNYRAARTGTCAFCATPFGPEDEVMEYARGSMDHWHCAKRRAAGAEPGS